MVDLMKTKIEYIVSYGRDRGDRCFITVLNTNGLRKNNNSSNAEFKVSSPSIGSFIEGNEKNYIKFIYEEDDD